MTPRSIGLDLARRDGPAKVTGTATYAYETAVDQPAYCHPVQATIARGRVTGVDTGAASALPGVLTVLTEANAERLASTEDGELAVLQSTEIAFRGQLIGCVVAETSEIARQAADLVKVSYAEEDHETELTAEGDYDADATGDVLAAFAAAEHVVDQTYKTAMYHNNPMEPHATTALWQDKTLTLWESTQGVHPTRSTVAEVFGLDTSRIRVICPYVGGGFGSKGLPHANVILAAMAARALPGRPVKLAVTRQQMFSLTGYRTPTIQRVRLAADRDGRLSALAFDVAEQTSKVKEFAEQSGKPSRTMYAAPNRRVAHRLAALDVPVTSWMRAPGECPGMFGPEVAMDELADQLGLDPIELRLLNDPAEDPESGKPFSSRNLADCLRTGAERFGWADRGPRREGRWLIGCGVAASVYPVNRMPESTAAIRFAGGRYTVDIGAADLGTGTWTTLPQVAADALGVPVDEVEVRIGDTDYPNASVAGGSSGMITWGSAVLDAVAVFREKFGADPADGDEAEGSVSENPEEENFAMSAFGAQFAEARVHADTGEVRVPRMHGVFAVGRVINPRTTRSQLVGGMTMGLSMALHEQSVLDPRFGHVVNHDLAEYHVAANADAGQLTAEWLDEHDPHVNAMGAKGVGEIGIVGAAAAVVNAVHRATGVRVRDLPVTLDKLLLSSPRGL